MSEAQLSRDQVKDYLKNLSLIDAAALVKELEAELGVSAAAPVAAAAAPAGTKRWTSWPIAFARRSPSMGPTRSPSMRPVSS